MAIVAGVDFGTLSVRVSIVDSERGLLDSAVAEYPLHRKREDPEYATQSHEDHMRALAEATRQAVKLAGISGEQVKSIALDTTGSSVIPVGEGMVPLDDYYLWCDHRAKQEAAQITELARIEKLEAMRESMPMENSRRAYEANNIWQCGLLIARSALARLESRGAHYRTDYPAHDDAKFAKHSVLAGERVKFE